MTTKIMQPSSDIAESLCRKITIDLPEYFGLPECNEQYALGIRQKTNFAIEVQSKLVGLLSLEFPYPQNANIYWMGILKKHQHQGYGRLLVQAAIDYAKEKDADTMTVETLSPAESDKNYLKTWQFYLNMSFKPLFNLKPAGYKWNMVYMCLTIG